ncbi:MAG: YbhB/YbcL family Raf kinase inhibitor-like protein [Candidatus Competibacteraceae bacterium]|nr:YbhB/YbcL family Raf kinase inhibitor-like protein [Candidatus Competibacteraceae bacterium]
MRLTSTSIHEGQPIAEAFAFCAYDPGSHVKMAANRNPDLAWDGVPQGTKSLVLICHDPDVPSRPDDVNQEGRQVPADLPRVDFIHWVLVDLPPDPAEIRAGEFCDGITPKGKPGPEGGPRGTRQGLNSYTDWFAGDSQMEGKYFGYDGPCPPWNDSVVHHYVFTLYALSVERLPVEGEFSATETLNAMQGHVLAKASITGTYSLNPKVPA